MQNLTDFNRKMKTNKKKDRKRVLKSLKGKERNERWERENVLKVEYIPNVNFNLNL